jgi:hypothetical protein
LEYHTVSLADVQLTIAAEFSKELRNLRLIADGEFNDGRILAETALCPLEFLLTSDSHLLSIDREKLKALFEKKHLPEVQIVAPRGRYAKLGRR